MNTKAQNIMTVFVSLGWLFNLVAPAFFKAYDSNLAANAPLMLVLGSLYAVRKKNENEGAS